MMYLLRIITLSTLALLLTGCASYQFGPRSLYRNDIQTIYVPIVRNETLRADLGVRLTEALIKAIESQTPYKVVGTPMADSTLTCSLLSENKRVLTETVTDEPRSLESSVVVKVNWLDRQGRVLMENRLLPPGEFAFYFSQAVDFVPEAGQSISTAHQRAIDRMASDIIHQMEVRW